MLRAVHVEVTALANGALCRGCRRWWPWRFLSQASLNLERSLSLESHLGEGLLQVVLAGTAAGASSGSFGTFLIVL